MRIRESVIIPEIETARAAFDRDFTQAQKNKLIELLKASEVGILFYIKDNRTMARVRTQLNPKVAKLVNGKIVITNFPLPSFEFDTEEEANEMFTNIFP